MMARVRKKSLGPSLLKRKTSFKRGLVRNVCAAMEEGAISLGNETRKEMLIAEKSKGIAISSVLGREGEELEIRKKKR